VLSLQPNQPATEPFMIKIMDPPSDIEGLGEVLLGALGITGAIVVAALVTGLVFAALLFLVRKYSSSEPGSTG
jgi:hypothetical protein